MKKVHCIKEIKDKNGNLKHVVLVYGELTEKDERYGVVVDNVVMNKQGTRIKHYLPGGAFIDNSMNVSKVRSFNMGWAICSAKDKFDYEEGVRLCKKRFSESPLTTRSFTLLSVDAVSAIVNSEAEYIARNIEKYLTKFGNRYDDAESDCKFSIGDWISFKMNDDGYNYAAKIGAITNDGKFIFERLYRYCEKQNGSFHSISKSMTSYDYTTAYDVKNPKHASEDEMKTIERLFNDM